MELRLDIGINQIIGLIKQLPSDQKLIIKEEIDKEIKTKKSISQHDDLTELLLSGPVMSEEEEQNFKNFNKELIV